MSRGSRVERAIERRRKPSLGRAAPATKRRAPGAAPARSVGGLDDDGLVAAAMAARELAHAPYSRFLVGAALRSEDGRVFTGCNVENSSYGLSICAERVAMTKAVSEGAREFVEIAVVTQSEAPSPPCGACRQFLAELAPTLRVVLANTKGAREVTDLRALLPHAFDKGYF